MNLNYEVIASKAAKIAAAYSSNDPLSILQSLPNVLLVPFNTTYTYISPSFKYALVVKDQDALTMVNDLDDNKQYIVIYNKDIPPFNLRFALARELGHIVLGNDDRSEANFFACQLISPAPVSKVKFRPAMKTISASFKSMQVYDSIADMKAALAEEHNRFNQFIGKSSKHYEPADICVHSLNEQDIFGGWSNYSTVSINGKPIGYCGR